MSFKGVSDDPLRNAVQEELCSKIGTKQTLSRSIELACRAEKELFDRCPSSTDPIYTETCGKLLAILGDGANGMNLQQRLLMGMIQPEQWVQEHAPKAYVKKKVIKKTASASAASSSTAKPTAAASLKSSVAKEAKAKEDATVKGDSSYYFFKSTPKDEAVKYQPKKLETNDALLTAAPAKHVAAGHSSWNAAGSWEERDLDKWAFETLAADLDEWAAGVDGKGIVVNDTNVKGKGWDIKGDCSIALGKGKKRVTFELKAELAFTGTHKKKEGEEEGSEGTVVEGEYDIPEIDDVDGKDGDYVVNIKINKPHSNDPEYSAIKSNLRKTEKEIKKVVLAFINKLHEQ